MKKLLRRLVVLFTVAMLFSSTVAPSYADEIADNLQNVLTADEMKRFEAMEDSEKAEIREDLIGAAAKEKCSDFVYSTNIRLFSFDGKDCEETTREALEVMYPSGASIFKGELAMNFCDALDEAGATWGAVSTCKRDEQTAQNKIDNQAEIRDWLSQSDFGKGVLNVVDAIDNTVDFVADPKSGLEEVANSSKTESIALTSKVLEELTSTTEFDASSQDFKDRWALYAGIGVVGLSIMLLILFKHHSNAEISDDDFSNSILYYLPTSLFLVIYGPWAINEIQHRIAPLTSGTTDWSAEMISNFITVISRFASLESSSWFGPLAAIIFFGMLFIGSIALMIYFLLIPIFQQLMGLAIAALIGMLISPKTRRYVLKIASTLATLLILKPVVFLVMGAVFGVLASQTAFKEGTDDVLVNVGNLGATAFIMLLIVLSPAAIFRWMPVIQSREANFGGISPEISAGVGAAAGGMAGGLAGAGAGAVRRAISTRRGTASSTPSSSPGTGNGSSSRPVAGDRTAGEGPAGTSTAGQGPAAARSSHDGSSPAAGTGTSEGSGAAASSGPSGGQVSAGTPGQSAPTEVMGRATSPRAGNAGDAGSAESSSGSRGADGPGAAGSSGRGSEGGAVGRHTSPTTANTQARAADRAYRPLRTGRVGMLANARYAMSNAAAHARIAQQDSDPDTWDSFKD